MNSPPLPTQPKLKIASRRLERIEWTKRVRCGEIMCIDLHSLHDKTKTKWNWCHAMLQTPFKFKAFQFQSRFVWSGRSKTQITTLDFDGFQTFFFQIYRMAIGWLAIRDLTSPIFSLEMSTEPSSIRGVFDWWWGVPNAICTYVRALQRRITSYRQTCWGHRMWYLFGHWHWTFTNDLTASFVWVRHEKSTSAQKLYARFDCIHRTFATSLDYVTVSCS